MRVKEVVTLEGCQEASKASHPATFFTHPSTQPLTHSNYHSPSRFTTLHWHGQVKEEVADPECRQVASKAYATLHRVGGEGRVAATVKADAKAYLDTLKVTELHGLISRNGSFDEHEERLGSAQACHGSAFAAAFTPALLACWTEQQKVAFSISHQSAT